MYKKITGRIVSTVIIMLVLGVIMFAAKENIYAGSDINQSGEARYPVQITFYNLETGMEAAFQDLEISFWRGVFSYEERLRLKAETTWGGQIITKLPAGIYTMQAGSYFSSIYSIPDFTYQKIEITKGINELRGYLMPVIPEGQSLVILLWEEDDIDLDLIVDTPHQEEGGGYIGGRICIDEYGNRIVKGSSTGCEAAYINTAEDGNYQIYINDYTNTMAENYDADTLHNLNACVYIYDSQGLVQAYEVPAGENGVVWKVAQINGSRVMADQKVYPKAEDKSWWLENLSKKQLANTVAYDKDGSIEAWHEYGYDDQGNLVKHARFSEYGDISGWDEYSYDRKGKCIKVLYYDYSGTLSTWEKYDYDSLGNLIKDTLYDGDTNAVVRRHVYDYDQFGNETRNISYWGNDSIREGWEKTYDIYGNNIRYISYKDNAVTGWYEYAYDARGNRVKESRYNENGSLLFGWTEYRYDEEGNQTGNINYNCDGTINNGWEKSYGSYGNEIKYVEYSDGGIKHSKKYSYDSRENLIKEVSYGSDGSISGWNEYRYNSEGDPVGRVFYNSDGTIYAGWEKSYDDQGNEIKYVSYSEGIIDWFYEYSYDSYGNQIKVCHYDTNGNMIDWFEYGYDDQGSKIKETRYLGEGTMYPSWEKNYDSQGNEIKYIDYYNGDIVDWFEYAYDEEGNKIKEIDRNSDGSISSGWEERYDGEGNKSRYISYKYYGIDFREEFFYK